MDVEIPKAEQPLIHRHRIHRNRPVDRREHERPLFAAGDALLQFGSPCGQRTLDFSGVISGFGVPGGIDLADIAFGPGTVVDFTEALDNTSGTLTGHLHR